MPRTEGAVFGHLTEAQRAQGKLQGARQGMRRTRDAAFSSGQHGAEPELAVSPPAPAASHARDKQASCIREPCSVFCFCFLGHYKTNWLILGLLPLRKIFTMGNRYESMSHISYNNNKALVLISGLFEGRNPLL